MGRGFITNVGHLMVIYPEEEGSPYPANSYVTEDMSMAYVTEDGSSVYVTES